MNNNFWHRLDELVATCHVIVDRPRGSSHPRYPDFVYPLDYGYLDGTRAVDGDGVDVWVGSLPEQGVTGAICTVDLVKHDVEVKILLGCTPEEAQMILTIHNTGSQAATLLKRPDS